MSDGVPRCGAKTKRCRECGHKYGKAEYDLWECPECGESRACRRKVGREGERCRYHGGESLKGIASPLIKHGRYSKYLPDSLVHRYREARADPELLSLRDDVALVDARLTGLVQQLDTGEDRDLWSALQATYQTLTRARAEGKTRDMAQALITMGSLIESGAEQGVLWDEIGKVLEQRRKLVESEHKRLVEMRQMITVERAMILVTALVNAVAKRVSDRATINAIAADFREIVGEGNSVPARAGGGRDGESATSDIDAVPAMDTAVSDHPG